MTCTSSAAVASRPSPCHAHNSPFVPSATRAQEREKRNIIKEGKAATAAAEEATAEAKAAELAQTPTNAVELARQWDAFASAEKKYR